MHGTTVTHGQVIIGQGAS